MAVLSFRETKKLLLSYKIPFCESYLSTSKKEVLKFARKIGFPVVLKISSPNIFHKTDIGGIEVGIKDESELKRAFSEILKNVEKERPEAKIDGILIQKQVSGQEVVIGMKRDPAFGPVLMFGLGGIFVELLKDVAFRVAPVDKREARKMIKEIKGFKVLKGFRGKKEVNIEKIAKILVNVSILSLKEKDIKEIDLNPIIVNKNNAWVVDPRFIYEKT